MNSNNNDGDDALLLSRHDLDWAVQQGLMGAMSDAQVDTLWHQWRFRQQQNQHEPQPRRRLAASTVSYYAGTALIGLGLLWILYEAWANEWGGWVVFLIAAVYLGILYWAGHVFWDKYQRLAGLLLTIAVCIVPIAVYGLQYQLGLWYHPDGVDPAYYNPLDHVDTVRELVNLLPMEMSAIVAALVTLLCYPVPLLTAVPLYTSWFMTYGWTYHWWMGDYKNDMVGIITMLYGLLVLVGAYGLERYISASSSSSSRFDWAFWMYTVGATAFWSGMSFSDFSYRNEANQFWICTVNIGFITLAVVLGRRVFMVLGALGVFIYLLHLNDLFGEIIIFPFVITLMGGFVVGWGVYRNRLDRDDTLTQLLLDSQDQQRAQSGELPLHAMDDDADQANLPIQQTSLHEPSTSPVSTASLSAEDELAE